MLLKAWSWTSSLLRELLEMQILGPLRFRNHVAGHLPAAGAGSRVWGFQLCLLHYIDVSVLTVLGFSCFLICELKRGVCSGPRW